VHIFIHQNYLYIGTLHPRMINENHIALPTIEWLPMVCKPVTNLGVKAYLNSFMSILYQFLFSEKLPRVLPLMKELLQLTKDTRIGD